MNPRTRYKPNEAATKMLSRSTEMMRFVKNLADEAATYAKQVAPVATGAYRDSIHGEAKVLGGKATGLVIADDFKALWIEFGTEKDFPAYAPLRKGVERVASKVRRK